MKKILLLSLLASAFSAQAAIVIKDNREFFCKNDYPYRHLESPDPLQGACFAISTTTSLPTLIVEGVEIDLNSPEAQERLEAEMRGDIEPVLLNQLQNIQGE